jgi:predicted PurR-regulated permease PerM
MSQKTIQLSFFIAITAGLLVLSFFVFKPYLGIIFISGVLSVVFYPLYQKFLGWFNGRQGLSAFITLLVIVFAIVIPTILISTSIFSEAIGLYNSIAFGGGAQKVVMYVDLLSSKVGQALFRNPSLEINIESYFKDTLNWVITHFDSIFSAVFKGILGFFLMLISIYYLLRNGSRIREGVVLWSPLPDNYDEEILTALRASVDAVIRGRLLVAVAQGVFLSIGFLIFGVANPILWGFVGSIASLIPALGTSLITIPAVLYLFINGSFGAGIGLLIWGAVAVGLVDDTLSFFILKKKIKVHPLIILFSILGGVQMFGIIGFIAGPVVVSAFLSLMRVYPFIMSHKELESKM